MRERHDVRTAMDRLLAAGGVSVPVRSVWTEVAGIRMHHLEAGTGPAVVLVHGGTGGGANWFRMIGPLAERYRVLAPDLPGFGLSDPIAVVSPLGRTAADRLLEWMAHHDVQDALLAGTSFGALVVLRLAQRSPRVARVLLLDGAGLGRGIHPSVRFAAGLPFTAWLVRPSRRGTAAVFRRLLTSNLSGMPVAQQQSLVDYLYASARAAGTPYLAVTLRHFAGSGGQREILSRDELRALPQPVSIVWGACDRLLPLAHAYRAAECVPDASLRVLPHIGHSPNWEQPDAVIEAIVALSSRRAHALPDGRHH
jgi:pimeloyl-ACP methyl ester carboxylesterase